MDFKQMSEFNKQNNATAAQSSAAYNEGLRSYMLRIYNYMAAALVLTGVTAFAVASNESLMQSIFMSPLKWVVMLAPLAFVLVLSFGINKLSTGAAQAIFWAFAVVMGVSMSSIFAVYAGETIFRAFFVTAATFGSLSLYGYTTKKDISGWGAFLIMGLIGLIIASIVNIFVGSGALGFAIDVIAILVFAGLTAYDTQRLKSIYSSIAGNTELMGRVVIMGALSLYLDFVNIFVHLLSLFGNND